VIASALPFLASGVSGDNQTVRHESDLSTNDSFGCKTAGLDQGEFQVSSDRNSSMCHVSMESMFTLSMSVSIHVPFLGALQLARFFFLSHG